MVTPWFQSEGLTPPHGWRTKVLAAIQEVKARHTKKKFFFLSPLLLFFYIRGFRWLLLSCNLPFFFFLPSLNSGLARRQLLCWAARLRPPVPCFMHEDDGLVIYSCWDRRAPVSAPRQRLGEGRCIYLQEEWPEMGIPLCRRDWRSELGCQDMGQGDWSPNQAVVLSF